MPKQRTTPMFSPALGRLADVSVSAPADGNALLFDQATGKWVPQAPATDAQTLEGHPAADFAAVGHDHAADYLAIAGQAADSAQLEGHPAADFAAAGHAHALAALSDVDLTGLGNGDLLKWDATSGKWVRLAPGASGSFASADTPAKTVTVVGGLVTAIV